MPNTISQLPKSFASTAAAILSPVALGSYIVLKFTHIARHELSGTHVGTDVIRTAYVIGACGLLACVAMKPRKARYGIAAINIIVSVGWLYFHLGGHIYSHASMVK